MGKIKLGRVLGLSILGVLSMMAMFAVSAQAAEFQISLKPALLATFTGSQVGTGFLLVAGRNLKLNCTTGKVENGSEINNPTDALAIIAFEGCTALNHKTNAELPCIIINPLALILILPFKLDDGWPAVLLEPDPTSVEGKEGKFTTLKMSGETCPLPEQNPVTGTIVALIDKNDTTTPQLLFNEAIQKLSGDAILFGGFSAFLNATVQLSLTGAHAGLGFGVA